jgi:hypothetical protein
VPHGYGDGAGLPVCLVLHGATARPRDYQGFGLPRFLTAAVHRGSPPFVLAGADGGLLWWEPGRGAGDDPRRMMLSEMPRWLDQRGFDSSRLAGWGWSMGGYGVLGLAEARPGWLRSVPRSARRSSRATRSRPRSDDWPGRRSGSGAGARIRCLATCSDW